MALLRHFWRDRSGNVAGAFAFSVLPLVGSVGVTRQYSGQVGKLNTHIAHVVTQ